MSSQNLEEKRKLYRMVQLGIFSFLPVVIGMLLYVVEPLWLGLVIGAMLIVGDFIALTLIKKQWGLDQPAHTTSPYGASPASQDKQTKQL